MDSCRIDFDAVLLLVAAAGCIELLELDWAAVIRFRSLVAAEAPKQSAVPAAACLAASASISDTVFTFPIPRTLELSALAVAAVAAISLAMSAAFAVSADGVSVVRCRLFGTGSPMSISSTWSGSLRARRFFADSSAVASRMTGSSGPSNFREVVPLSGEVRRRFSVG